jgi:hemolysin activation/secretion protein
MASAAIGQTTPPPDAGLLMTTPAAPPATPPKSPTLDVQQPVRPPLVAPGGATVKVVSFKITGNTVFSDGLLQALLSDYVGKQLDMAGLDQAAAQISQYYRRHGYFVARAYLPAQEIASGKLEIAVLEGRLGAVTLEAKGDKRLKPAVAQELVTGAAPLNAPVNEQNLERGLMLVSDLPGIEVKSTLVPGATPGTSDLVLETTEGPMGTGSVDIDNFGNKYTGEFRVGATLNLNDLSGYGDQLVVRGMTSGSGMNYGRLAYSLPVGNLGTKVGLSYTRMNYELGESFASLLASGSSNVTSLFAVHPIMRSRNTNLYVTGSLDHKRMADEQLAVNVTDAKTVNVLVLGLAGDLRDGVGGGGINTGSLTLTAGDLDLSGNANSNAFSDASTAQTKGGYSKFNFSLARLQRVDDSWSVYASLSGQGASKNLDTSEKFILGGLGVRAYPMGEAAADSGLLLNLEARYDIPNFEYGNLQLVGFIDTGSVRLHRSPWTGWSIGSVVPNTYSLSGMGVGVNLYRGSDFAIRSSLAWKLGSNPGADALGRDVDGSDKGVRFWLQASKQF